MSKPIEASTLTINELAKRAGVGTTTVIRMIEALGMEKYNQFKTRLREGMFAQHTTSYMVYWDNENSAMNPEDNLLSAIGSCMEVIESLKRPDFIRQVSEGAHMIIEAKRVYVLGLRMSVGTSMLLEHTLRNYSFETQLLSREADYVIDRICEMDEEDILVCLASSPMAKTTADAIRLCSKLGRKVLVITGRLDSDLADLATGVIDIRMSRRPATIPAITVALELLSMELARLLDERGESERKRHIDKVEKISADNDIAIWE